MQKLLKFSSQIDDVNSLITRLCSWLTLAMVLLQLFVVIMRYVFGAGSIQMQESITYMHAMLFMLAAGGTLLIDGHVRVDIFYREAAPKRKALIDLLGCCVFLIPFGVLIIYTSWNYVSLSWRVQEGSRETGGLQAVYLLKAVIPLMASLLIAQAVSQIIKAANILRGGSPKISSGSPKISSGVSAGEKN